MNYAWVFLVCLALSAPSWAFDMADFGRLQIETQRITGKPYLKKPWLFFLPEPAFSQMACNQVPTRCSVAGVTFGNGLIVVNIHKIDPDTIEGQAIIVHELVHVTQNFNQSLQGCVDDESEAYAVSAQWAKEQDSSTWMPKPEEIIAMCASALKL